MTTFQESISKGAPLPSLDDKNWGILEELYNRNYYLSHTPSGNSSGDPDPTKNAIPKRIHQVWLGSRYPKEYIVFLREWERHHPGWEIRIWTDKEAKKLEMTTRPLFESVRNLGAKSDILRYEILFQYGGMYIDTDFFCLKSFEDLLYLDFFAGTGHVVEAQVFNGLIGCTMNNSLIGSIIEELHEKGLDSDKRDYDAILNFSGPRLLTKAFFESSNRGNAVVFPTTFFYPFPASERFRIRGKFTDQIKRAVMAYEQPESYCIHLWKTAWQH